MSWFPKIKIVEGLKLLFRIIKNQSPQNPLGYDIFKSRINLKKLKILQ